MEAFDAVGVLIARGMNNLFTNRLNMLMSQVAFEIQRFMFREDSAKLLVKARSKRFNSQ
jgi:hypothetical protein